MRHVTQAFPLASLFSRTPVAAQNLVEDKWQWSPTGSAHAIRRMLPVFLTAVLFLGGATAGPTFAQVASVEEIPLRPADTSSPRDTLREFDESFTRAMELWRAGAPPEEYRRPGFRALETFDFSELAARGRTTMETETALWLKEVIDRISMPDYAEIPGDEEVAALPVETPLNGWSIPNTSITITRISEGPRAGEYLFSAQTVAQLERFYSEVVDLPYKDGALAGIFDEFMQSPGPPVPRSWGKRLPAWSKVVFFGEAVWQWLALIGGGTAVYLFIRTALRLGKRWDRRLTEERGHLRLGRIVAVLFGVLLIYLLRTASVYVFRLGGEIWLVLASLLWTLVFAGIGWAIFLTSGWLATSINNARQVREASIDGQLVQTVLRLASLILVAVLLVYAAGFFGIPLTPVLASLGMGGLAIALAVRPTLENIIGGLTLFADKPVRIGDFCQYGQDVGTVEEIGLRSTRLRKRDDTVVTVPNADFSQRELTNFGKARRRLYNETIGLRYETTPEQLRYVIASIREMLNGHPKVYPDMLNVRFSGFGDYALKVEIFAYLRTRDWFNNRAIREDVNFRIMEVVKQSGAGFAFPSMTTYLGRDVLPDAEQRQMTEDTVAEWRKTGRLPFPDPDPGSVATQQDLLDYPPKGSPGYSPPAAPRPNDPDRS